MIFLDIDGVLNHSEPYAIYDRPKLHAPLVERLQGILDRTGAGLVLVSNWKGILPLEVTFEYLAEAGLRRPVPIRGCTSFLFTRGHEVEAFIDYTHYAGPFVILDDRDDYFPQQPLIRCDPFVGLTAEQAEKAVQCLTTPN